MMLVSLGRTGRIGLTRDKGSLLIDNSLAAYWLAARGFDLDFTKADQTYQEVTGITPADDPGESIGLALEGHAWARRSLAQELAQQSELITNGTFDTDVSGWASISGGIISQSAGAMVITKVNADTSGGASQGFVAQAGKQYRVSLTLLSIGSTARLTVSSVQGAGTNYLPISDISTPGTYSFVVTPGVAAPFVNIFSIGPSAGTADVVVDNVSVKLISGNHGIQATAGSRPTRQAGGVARFAADDSLPMPFAAAASGFAMFRAKRTGAAGTAQWVIAAYNGVDARFRVGYNASGLAACHLGNASELSAGADLLNVDTTIGARWDGSTQELVRNGLVIATSARAGALPAVAVSVGAENNNGTAIRFFNGDAWRALCGDVKPTDAELLAFHGELMAA